MENCSALIQSEGKNDKSPSEQGIIDLTDSPDFREKSVVDENSNMDSFEEDTMIIDSKDDHLDEPIGFAHDERKRIFNFTINFKIQYDNNKRWRAIRNFILCYGY